MALYNAGIMKWLVPQSGDHLARVKNTAFISAAVDECNFLARSYTQDDQLKADR